MVRLLRWLRPREGWGIFLLLLITVLCLPATALEAEWVPGDEGLMWLAPFALLVGRWLAWRDDWGWDVWLPVGASLGLLTGLSVASHAAIFLPGGGDAALDFAQRWTGWLEVAFSGGRSEDPDIFLFYVSLLCWGAVLFAAWAFYRRQHSLLASLSLVALEALSVFYSGQGVLWLVGGLGCGLLLMAVGNLAQARRTWEAEGVDYATDLGVGTVVAAVFITVPITLLSLFGPEFSVRRVSDWFWRTFREPSTQVEETADRLFGGVNPPRGPASEGIGAGGGASSYLPSTHLLGGRPDLLDEVVMMVWTDEPPPPPQEYFPYDRYDQQPSSPPHYWRGGAFDYYSGLGWTATVDSREEVEGELPLPSPPTYREVEQRFEFTAPHGDTLYALSMPVWVGQPVEAVWRVPPALLPGEREREEGDLAGLASEVISYTVVSRLATPTADDLRAAPPLYPDWVREHYLQLPEAVPQRVIDLAWEVVAEGETVYEQARLLERYLRSYPYSLEVGEPPEDRDVADYFLFEAREGYCDYYATAFVVMARAVGIPARLASGYVGGEYDYDRGAYLVRQLDGHSWPEVYFSGWGWIGFEPTGSQPVTVLPEEMALPEGRLLGPPGPPARVVRLRWRRFGAGFAVAVGVGLAVAMVWRWRQRWAAWSVGLPLVWGRVGRAGARLGVPPDPSFTPREYAAALAAELSARAGQVRWWRDRWIKLATQGRMALGRLAALYSAQVYGRPQHPPADEQVAREMWARLRGPLRWFGWLRSLRYVSLRGPRD